MAESKELKVDIDKYSDHLYEKVIATQHISGSETNNDTDNVLYDNSTFIGKYIPIIEVANTTISPQDIKSLYLTQGKHRYTVRMEIYSSSLGTITIPNASTMAYVVLVPRIEGIYNTIKMGFSCKSPLKKGNVWYFEGILTIPRLNVPVWFTQDACNTYKCFKLLCELVDVGFVTIGDCLNVEDTLQRYSSKINPIAPIEALKELILNSGLLDEAMFDFWIDCYNNVTLANIYDIFHNVSEQDIKDMKIKAINGIPNQDIALSIEPNVIEIPRIITNYKYLGNIDIYIQSYTHSINNNAINKYGVQNTSYYMSADGSNSTSNNDISLIFQELIPKNIDELKGVDYGTFINEGCIGTEMSEYSSTIEAREYHNMLLDLMRMNYFVVNMEFPNFGLLRGELVGVLIMEDNKIMKSIMVDQRENASIANINNSENMNIDEDMDTSRYVDDSSSVINRVLSGLYYIDSVSYSYNSDYDNKIILTLFLIRLGELPSYFNKYTTAKVTND